MKTGPDLAREGAVAVDFYMTCVYERHRSTAELEKLLGRARISVGEELSVVAIWVKDGAGNESLLTQPCSCREGAWASSPWRPCIPGLPRR